MMQDRRRWPDALTGWTLPPPEAARRSGDTEPVRVFDSAEKAMAFLAGKFCGRSKVAGSRKLSGGAPLFVGKREQLVDHISLGLDRANS
jgi:hypothetical protein